jgi:hypothetical protein
MKQLEENVINSFKLAKIDIIELKQEINRLKTTQNILREEINKLKSVPSVKKTIIQNKVKKKFIASKKSNKFHDTHCPFAQNIKPKTKIVFKSKKTALNNGYKPCKCV